MVYFRPPPPKIYLTSNELPYIIITSEGETMPKIYERNPDTDEVREREFGMYDEDGMFTSEYLRENTKPEPPYRNYARESLEILARMERKIDALLEQKEQKENE